MVSRTSLVCVAYVIINKALHHTALARNLRKGDATPTKREAQESKPFTIQLINMGGDDSYNDAFEKAKSRWESVITNDLRDVEQGTVDDLFDGYFGEGTKTDVFVDDVLIGYRVRSFGGFTNVIGSAGPVIARINPFFRDPTSTISGIMDFNSDILKTFPDLAVKLTVLHEMGHVLGLGTFWSFKCGVRCMEGEKEYTCPLAKAEYEKLGLNKPLLLENDGGDGTKCGHWDESSFQSLFSSELMTGKFELEKVQPLSRVTLAALEDLGGYTVNYDEADDFDGSLIPSFTSGTSPVPNNFAFNVSGEMAEPPTMKMLPMN